jgi:osmotically-inducible protein OsmY
MKGRVRGLAVGVGALGFLAGVARAQPAPGPAEAAAASRIESRLRVDPDLKNNQIDVRVEAGVAVLSGRVDSEGEKAKAAKLARVADIDVVDNRLDVGSGGVTRAMSDSAVTTKVKAQILGNTTLREADIAVTTNNGVVTLSGRVPSQEARNLAVDLVRNTGGVARVEDRLEVAAH